MTDVKVIDISKLGLREREFTETVMETSGTLGMSGMRGMVSRVVKRMVPTSHLNEEDALLITQADAEWVQTPKELKAHPKWMTSWGGRRWFTDKKPVVGKAAPVEGEEAPEKKPTRKRRRPAKRSNR
jgi:hypothetical protein